ncbi:MAG TPA: two-component regulator propeller domain-containing protein, partial [Vicinamibacteria bacterium]
MRATRVEARGSLLALALGLWASSAQGLDPGRAVTQYRHDAWTTREGLPQSSVESIAQTPDGYLWLGTQEGLAQFDGIRITVFDKSNTRALRHNRVTALLADRAGSLWVGTEGGGVARLRGREWTLASTGLPNPRVRCLAQDERGTVWAGTDEGLVRWQESRFVADPAWDVRLRGPISALHAGPGGRLFVGVQDGLLSMSPGVAGVHEVGGSDWGVVKAVLQDPSGRLWVGTTGGLFVGALGGEAPASFRAVLPGRVVTAIRR